MRVYGYVVGYFDEDGLFVQPRVTRITRSRKEAEEYAYRHWSERTPYELFRLMR